MCGAIWPYCVGAPQSPLNLKHTGCTAHWKYAPLKTPRTCNRDTCKTALTSRGGERFAFLSRIDRYTCSSYFFQNACLSEICINCWKKRLESDNLFATKANQLGLSIISSCASLTHVLLVHLACLFLIISFSVSDISGTDHGLHDCMSCSKSSAATVGTVIKLLDSFRPVIRISPTTADTDRRRGNVWNTRNWNSLSWLFFFLPPELYTAEHRLSD